MPASTVNLDTLHLAIPTTGPQRLVDGAGAALAPLLIVTDNDNPVDELDPNEIFIAQGQSGPAVLVLPDGTAPDMDAAVLTPYSLVTPPGAIRVG